MDVFGAYKNNFFAKQALLSEKRRNKLRKLIETLRIIIMKESKQLDREIIVAMIVSCLEDVLSQQDVQSDKPVGEETHLIDHLSVLDSMGLVNLIVDLEQIIANRSGIYLVLANERALSQKSSPFKTVESLADYISILINEELENVGE